MSVSSIAARLSALQISSQIMGRRCASGAPQIIPFQGLSEDQDQQLPGCPSYSVREAARNVRDVARTAGDLRPARTACGWGLSPAEVRRLSGAMHFLHRTSLRRAGLPCWYVVLGD